MTDHIGYLKERIVEELQENYGVSSLEEAEILLKKIDADITAHQEHLDLLVEELDAAKQQFDL